MNSQKMRTTKLRIANIVHSAAVWWKRLFCSLIVASSVSDNYDGQLDGCDLMICGQNYHGGDVQNGCGARLTFQFLAVFSCVIIIFYRFRWTQAPAYTPDTGTKKIVGELQTLPPTEV